MRLSRTCDHIWLCTHREDTEAMVTTQQQCTKCESLKTTVFYPALDKSEIRVKEMESLKAKIEELQDTIISLKHQEKPKIFQVLGRSIKEQNFQRILEIESVTTCYAGLVIEVKIP